MFIVQITGDFTFVFIILNFYLNDLKNSKKFDFDFAIHSIEGNSIEEVSISA